MADVMVPALERSEYMVELRNIADNIVRERLQHSEVHPVTHSGPAAEDSSCEIAQSHPETPTHIGTSAKAAGSSHVLPLVESHCFVLEKELQRVPGDVDVGPAFHIPMTQTKSLEDLPSQLGFDWQDSVSQNPTPGVGAARNLDVELDGVGGIRIVAEPMHTFVEVLQIAEEAVRDAMPPTAEVPTPDMVDADAT